MTREKRPDSDCISVGSASNSSGFNKKWRAIVERSGHIGRVPSGENKRAMIVVYADRNGHCGAYHTSTIGLFSVPETRQYFIASAVFSAAAAAAARDAS